MVARMISAMVMILLLVNEYSPMRKISYSIKSRNFSILFVCCLSVTCSKAPAEEISYHAVNIVNKFKNDCVIQYSILFTIFVLRFGGQSEEVDLEVLKPVNDAFALRTLFCRNKKTTKNRFNVRR